MSMKVEVCVSGCDDNTEITIDVSESELVFLKRIAELITDESRYGCQPTMSVELVTSTTPLEKEKP